MSPDVEMHYRFENASCTQLPKRLGVKKLRFAAILHLQCHYVESNWGKAFLDMQHQARRTGFLYFANGSLLVAENCFSLEKVVGLWSSGGGGLLNLLDCPDVNFSQLMLPV